MEKLKTSLLRTVMAWGLGVPYTFLISALAMLSFLITRNKLTVHYYGKLWGRGVLWLGGVKVTVSGQENIPDTDETLLVIANHQSICDILALTGFFPICFAWIAKKELFMIPGLGSAMKAAGNISIDRSQKENAYDALKKAAKQLRDFTVIIFPEGTRTRTGAVGKFKPGASFLAHAAGVPLLPVTITGSWDCLRPDGLMIAPGNIHIHISSTVSTSGKSRREIHSILANIQKEIAARVDES